jgi:hypothetical protein
MLSGIYSGMLSNGVRSVQANCPTANCTWPVTPSVAVCGACAESTYEPVGCDSTSMLCNYTLPSGHTTQLFNFVGQKIGIDGGEVGFQVIPSNFGSIFNREQGNRAYIMNLELFGLPLNYSIPVDQNTPPPRSLNLTNTECALWMCVQAYNTTMSNNIQHEEIVDVFDTVNGTVYRFNMQRTAKFQLPTVPRSQDSADESNFTIAFQAGKALEYLFVNTMQGNASLKPTLSSDLINRAWYVSTNASVWNPWIANLATSMTNVMRSTNSMSRDQYNGSQYELTVTVRWEWLVFPAALVAASLVYLLVIMFQTAASPVYSWKGSPLTMLLFELDQDISQEAHGQVEKQGGLLKTIGGTKVRMTREDGGIRKLHAC